MEGHNDILIVRWEIHPIAHQLQSTFAMCSHIVAIHIAILILFRSLCHNLNAYGNIHLRCYQHYHSHSMHCSNGRSTLNASCHTGWTCCSPAETPIISVKRETCFIMLYPQVSLEATLLGLKINIHKNWETQNLCSGHVMEPTELMKTRFEVLTVMLLAVESLVECDAMSQAFGTWCCAGIQCLQNNGIYSQNDTASHPTGHESSATNS